ncbi:MAG: MarR family transcriptional regulator [Actinomycetota bacterium]|nr:MarR family transcriptional regulator [Actinomycetota bacterium]
MSGGTRTRTRTRWLNAEQQRAWRAYVIGTTLLLDRLDRDLRQAHDISLDEYEILVRLAESPNRRMRMAILADAMCHSRSRITHTVGRMERAHWVIRNPSPDDGRGVDAVLTDAGHELLVEAAPVHVEGVRRHLVELADAGELGSVGALFNRVADALMPDHPKAIDIR